MFPKYLIVDSLYRMRVEWERNDKEIRLLYAQEERDLYDAMMARGPMIEADLDDRMPLPCREMRESDL
jgi:hypothetical protein